MALHDTLIYCPITDNDQAGIVNMRCLDCKQPYTNASGHYTTMINGKPVSDGDYTTSINV